MGLDMYLYAQTYVQNWNHFKPEQRHVISVLRGGMPHPTIKPERIAYVLEQIAYWRKANAVHAWFVKHCGEGVDECQEIYVPVEKLRELVTLCKAVLTDHARAEHDLPTQSGFFFGSTEYDDGYFQDLEDTVKQLEPCLTVPDADYRYRASW